VKANLNTVKAKGEEVPFGSRSGEWMQCRMQDADLEDAGCRCKCDADADDGPGYVDVDVMQMMDSQKF
jgi:hypothetical protein